MGHLIAGREQVPQPVDPPSQLSVIDPQGASRLPDLVSRLKARTGQVVVDVVLDQARPRVRRREISGDHFRVGDFTGSEPLCRKCLELIVRLCALLEQAGEGISDQLLQRSVERRPGENDRCSQEVLLRRGKPASDPAARSA